MSDSFLVAHFSTDVCCVYVYVCVSVCNACSNKLSAIHIVGVVYK